MFLGASSNASSASNDLTSRMIPNASNLIQFVGRFIDPKPNVVGA